MEKIILLITHRRGFEADLIIRLARERNLPLVRLNQDDYPDRLGVDFKLTNSDLRVQFNLPKRTFDESEVAIAWYQQGYKATFADLHEAEQALAQSETATFLSGLWRTLGWQWLNSPYQIQAANKLVQLRLAQLHGLKIPNTLVSTSGQTINEFHSLNRNTIFKTMGTQLLDVRGHTLAAYTHVVDEDVISHLDRAAIAPTLFQQQVEKEFEVRTVLVGEHIFSARIESQRDESTSIDWRKNPELIQKLITPYDLPYDVAMQSRSLMTDLGLGFGALDFIVTPEGEHVFLEVNPTGSWNWTQQATDQPIGEAIVDTLEGYL